MVARHSACSGCTAVRSRHGSLLAYVAESGREAVLAWWLLSLMPEAPMHYTKRTQSPESPARHPGADSRRRPLPTVTSEELATVTGGRGEDLLAP
jgi:hypothetical protein